MRMDIALFVFRVIFIIEQRHINLASKVKAKKNVKDLADVEMADATKAGPSIQSLIDKAVSARLKNLTATPGSSSKAKASNLSDNYLNIPDFFLGQEEGQGQPEEGQSR